MNTNSKIIVITGAESTGKSELTERLANHFQTPFIPEFARSYVENLERKYNFDDIEIIAREQVAQLYAVKKQNPSLIFADTWLIITKIWFEVVFGNSPAWIEAEIRKSKIDLFLVCDTDLPWKPDNVRENGGENRLFLQKRYIETIKEYDFSFEIVSGKEETRLQNALNCLDSHFIKK